MRSPADGARGRPEGRLAAAATLALAAAAFVTAPGLARADGLYGRFEGDLELRLGAGAAVAKGGPALAVDAGARYLGTAGLYVSYADALGTSGPRSARSIATGVDLAPLFLARYASDAERGPAHLDLFLDSIAFGVGAFWDQPHGSAFASTPGLEITLGLAVPFLARVNGPYLAIRGALRWRDVDLGGHPEGVAERGALLTLTLGWRHVVGVHLVDGGDMR